MAEKAFRLGGLYINKGVFKNIDSRGQIFDLARILGGHLQAFGLFSGRHKEDQDMKEFNFVSVVFGVVGGFLGNLFGGYDILLHTLLILIAADYVSGVIKAVIQKKLSAEIGAAGIMKKVLTLTVIVVTVALEKMINNDLLPIREMVIAFYISNEGMSFFENASAFIPFPEQLKNVFLNLRENGEEKNK